MSTPRGIRNNNPLNIRKGSNWKGERPNQTDPAFEEFVSMEYGIRAAFKLIINHITGFGGRRPKANTIQKLISVWAPSSENNTAAYIRQVCAAAGMQPHQIINPKSMSQMVAIAQAMAKVECGVQMDKSLFESAWLLK